MVRDTTKQSARSLRPSKAVSVRFTSAGSKLSRVELETIQRRMAEDLAFVDHPSFRCSDHNANKGQDETLLFHLDTVPDVGGVLAGDMAPFSHLLSRDEERDLFLRMNYAKFRLRQESQRTRNIRLPMSTAKRILQWHRLESDTRKRLVEGNLPLVLSMAKKVHIPGVDFGEMVSEGNMALLRAVDGFDCSRGFKFSTYACRAIMKSFARLATKANRLRMRFTMEFDPAYEKSDWLQTRRQEAAEYCTEELVKILRANTAGLTDVELVVVKGRFAFGDSQTRKTLVEIGKILGLTKERVRQIQKKAVSKLRQALEARLIGI